jgi:3-hydroxyacyl-CoA dehydrogenase/enoyl-CoA hydratase/3-hydroxybutyryl-CoA epimerase
MNESFKHWTIRVDADRIGWLEIDQAGTTVNILSQEVILEFALALAMILKHDPIGLVLASAKPACFVAGADIREFSRISSANEASELARRAQALLAQLAALSIPTVAAINGTALGGGLELALACDYRVALDTPERCLGLPEVQLGIHPGFGGTVRSVALLGAPVALELMLSGRRLTPKEGLKLGLLDRVAPLRELREMAVDLIKHHPPPHRAPWFLRLLTLPFLRALLAARSHAAVARRARPEHYPAPYAIIELWRRYGGHGARAYAAEAESIGRMLTTSTSRNLVRVFLLRERLRSLPPIPGSAARVHIIGAGVMGSDIASWCATQGLAVSLQDRTQEIVDVALARARKSIEHRGRDRGDSAQIIARLKGDPQGTEVARADIVIEAIVEQLEAKRSLFKSLEPRLQSDAILASNTSSIPLEDIGAELTNPSRLVGLHFFNPVARMPLVEVVRSMTTSIETMHRAMAFVTKIGKLPLPCQSAPGFLVNRVLTPYMLEALRAQQEGHSIETVDAAAEDFGMPMGPVELADRVGIDVARQVARTLGGPSAGEIVGLLDTMVEQGKLGLKSGRGFYRYEQDRPVKSHNFPRPDTMLQDRLVLILLNECVACLADGIVDDADLLDAGLVFGAGFAPFRGGPLHYARERGIAAIIGRLDELAHQLGPRFKPHAGWKTLQL